MGLTKVGVVSNLSRVLSALYRALTQRSRGALQALEAFYVYPFPTILLSFSPSVPLSSSPSVPLASAFGCVYISGVTLWKQTKKCDL